MTERPDFEGVLETVIYCDSTTVDDMRRFYVDVLGLRPLGKMGFSFRVGTRRHVFLVFNVDETENQDEPPPHGARGQVHTCFLSPPQHYEEWKAYLREQAVEITSELTWTGGLRSFYFDDPAGNVLEIAEGDFWPE